jgi:hypothetical protein
MFGRAQARRAGAARDTAGAAISRSLELSVLLGSSTVPAGDDGRERGVRREGAQVCSVSLGA